MSALNALMVAVEAAERQRDQSRQMLQHTRSAQSAAQQQLDQLQGYANETEGRWGMRADASVAPEVMFHHYQFMDRLAHAITLQTAVVHDQEKRVAMAQSALLVTELRLTSLKKLTDKRRQELQQMQSRRDQKQTDERAALQYRQKRTSL